MSGPDWPLCKDWKRKGPRSGPQQRKQRPLGQSSGRNWKSRVPPHSGIASLQRETRPVVDSPVTEIAVAPEVSRRRGAKPADEERGQYYGKVLGRDAEYVYQDLEGGDMVKHRITALQAHLSDVKKIRGVKYQAGSVSIALERDTGKGQGR
jgi:hypothetical protein